MALISLCETTGFQIQTRDIFNPARGPLTYQALFEKLRLSSWGGTNTRHLKTAAEVEPMLRPGLLCTLLGVG